MVILINYVHFGFRYILSIHSLISESSWGPFPLILTLLRFSLQIIGHEAPFEALHQSLEVIQHLYVNKIEDNYLINLVIGVMKFDVVGVLFDLNKSLKITKEIPYSPINYYPISKYLLF